MSKKSSSLRPPPVQPAPMVQMTPWWKPLCTTPVATLGAVESAAVTSAAYTFHDVVGSTVFMSPLTSVPYQDTATCPAAPATTLGNTAVLETPFGTSSGAVQVAPLSPDEARARLYASPLSST